jgi:hypothetical protein
MPTNANLCTAHGPCDLFSITSSDEGRPISISHQLEYDDLINDCRKVLSDLAPSRLD